MIFIYGDQLSNIKHTKKIPYNIICLYINHTIKY